jgi:hypothetical protein
MKAQTPQQQLARFIARYSPEISKQARAVLKTLKAKLPGANILVYDNYNALAIGFCPTERASDVIFSFALYPRWINFFFLRGKGLPDPGKLLQGDGVRVRHIVLKDVALLDTPAVKTLMRHAMDRAPVAFDPKAKSKLIIKSVSATQRPRRPASAGRPLGTRSKP